MVYVAKARQAMLLMVCCAEAANICLFMAMNLRKWPQMLAPGPITGHYNQNAQMMLELLIYKIESYRTV